MKTITLTPQEFYAFKELAHKFRIWFTINVANGFVQVEANADVLEKLGY
jgi:hypothetical protein